MGKKYRSDALAAVHETALGLAEAGVMDKRTMKGFDDMCLTPVEELTAEQIRQIRLREKASQAVFARYPRRPAFDPRERAVAACFPVERQQRRGVRSVSR